MTTPGWLSSKASLVAAEIAAERQATYEFTLLCRIMRSVGVDTASVHRLVEADGYEPSLRWLTECTQFPVLLGAAKIPWMHAVPVGALFGHNFIKTPFFNEYVTFLTDNGYSDERSRCGLVFNWPGIPKGGSAMVLHSYPGDTWQGTDIYIGEGTRIVRPYGNPLVIYVIESFNDFLHSIGTVWFKD